MIVSGTGRALAAALCAALLLLVGTEPAPARESGAAAENVAAPVTAMKGGDTGAVGGGVLEPGDPQLDLLWVEEKNGDSIPMASVWRDEDGNEVTLAELIDKPTLILPVYFYCPSSCSLNLVNLATAIKRSLLDPGKDYEVIAFSFNAEEDEENARIAKRNYLRLLPVDFPAEKWRFLTSDQENITALVEAIGYTYRKQGDGTFIHPSALVAVAPDGMIIKYVYGSFVVGDVDMAVAEAWSGKPSISVKRFLGYCFTYDPARSRTIFHYAKLAVLLGFALMGVLFVCYVRRVSRKRTGAADERE